MKGSYGRYKVAMVLIGQSDAAIEKSHFNEISTFGLLKNETIKYILKIIDSLIESKCISTVGKDYPCIQLSDLGIKVLKGHATLKLNFPRKSSYRKGK